MLVSKSHQLQQHHSQQQQSQQQLNQQNFVQTKSTKTIKKSEKNKRSVIKSESKKSISELLGKNHGKDAPSKALTTFKSDNQLPSTSKGTNADNNNNNSNKTPPTKVKSGSWKRSEKQISGFNTLTNKKSKSLRKRSPTWLKFPSNSVKIAEKSAYVNAVETTSVCRPGTLYSDVLFGAGTSCLVKVKTLTPRRATNTAQKKLTKALIKCSGTDHEISDETELEIERELFPSLHVFTSNSSIRNDAALLGAISHTQAPIKTDTYEEADIVILQDRNDIQIKDKEVSYGNYLDHHFQHLNGDESSGLDVSVGICGASCSSVKKVDNSKRLAIDIASWNFLDADVSKDAYPKFLCQFDDEHYLKAEKMALLGLKLALGNSSQQGKFKF
ncbi:uncharacterized protein LOC119640286 [Glossina fuscipes]|uniref:Uncharacterized protein LOC119640286 n=1 Tax=Glossina fuscipes TaxID=7396 RepID=A0A9C5ZDI1_9MUSC|nr:uncharacterized protein LOC119640286 [Glossina fuscipes]